MADRTYEAIYDIETEAGELYTDKEIQFLSDSKSLMGKYNHARYAVSKLYRNRIKKITIKQIAEVQKSWWRRLFGL